PMKIHWSDEKGLRWPYVDGLLLTFDELHNRVYQVQNEKYPIKILHKGDSYKFLGVLSSDRHLFGVDAPGRIYLWGADSRGRDLLSRILYGGRVSLSIGLIGVIISFSIGLLVGGIA